MKKPQIIFVICLLGCVALCGCHSSGGATSKPAAPQSLYLRLGGEPAISAVVDDFVARAAADPKVNFTRQGTSHEWVPTPDHMALLKKHLIQFISMATDGPSQYTGKSMKTAHTGMGITDAEFSAITDDLAATLDKFNVPAEEKSELLTVVVSTRGDIVGQ